MIKLLTFSLTAALATAVPFRRQSNGLYANSTAVNSLLVSGPGYITAITYNGSFHVTSNYSAPGTTPSWLLPKSPTEFFAVDENSNATSLFALDAAEHTFTKTSEVNASAGIVHLEFNGPRTRMLGAAYGSAEVDVFDVSGADGNFSVLKTIASNDTPDQGQTAGHPHQALLEPSGRFFIVNDLGTDRFLVIDGSKDDFPVTNDYRLGTAGCGPRHGAFYPPPDRGLNKATHYLVVCETLSSVLVFQLIYSNTTIDFRNSQISSTFGPDSPPANSSSARAGEIVLEFDMLARRADVYVSNRLSGNETDSITHFSFAESGKGGMQLYFNDTVSSGGLLPRSIALSRDGSKLFAANQGGQSGLVVFARDTKNGTLSAEPLATMDNALFTGGQDGFGPQFVLDLPTAAGAALRPTGTLSPMSSSGCS